MLYNAAFVDYKASIDEARELVRDAIKKTYDKLSDRTQKLVKERYDNIMSII